MMSRSMREVIHRCPIELNWVSMQARYHEPATGRFLSEDPARDGVNWYLYADGNPAIIVDPSGCLTLAEILIDIKNDVENQLRQVQMGEVARQRALDQIERAIYKWAERMADALESDAWQIFGEGNVEMIGIHGRFRIMFHITKDKVLPHTVPHIQFAASGEKIVYFWLDANGIGHWASSGWLVP